MSVRHTAQPASPRRPGAGRTTLTTVGVLVASAAVGSAAAAAESRQADADLDAALSRTEGLLGAWESPQDVLDASHRTTRARAAQATTAQVAPALAQTFRFDIGFGPLADALRQFEQVTGLTVTVAGDVTRGLTTNGASGSLTGEQAIGRLLAGSALSWRQTSATQVIVEVRLAGDTVEVSGALPRIESFKYATPLVETPQTVQLIPRSIIEEQGATTLSEALRNVPGITMQAGEGGNAAPTTGDMFTMRGFDAQNSLFVDGVRDDGLISRDVYNLEQIEVFSGPTGSDVGRTNAAGYINMSSKAPGLIGVRGVTLAYGSGNSARGTFDFNQPLALGEQGTFLGNAAVRVNVLVQGGGTAGRDHVNRETRAIAPSIAFGLQTPTRLIVSGEIAHQDNVPDYGLHGAGSPIGPLTATAVVSPDPVNQSNFYGNPDADYDKSTKNNVTVRLEHDVRSGVTIRNQTRYNEASREAVVTAVSGAWNQTTNTINAGRQGSFRDNDILSNQTSLSARVTTGRLRHDLSAGLEVSSENYHAPGYTGFGAARAMDLHNPDVSLPVVGMDVVPSGVISDGTSDTVAFYLFDGVDLGSRVRVNGGVRVERYSTSSHNVTAAGVVTDLEGDGTLVTAKAGLVYRLTNQGNVYVSFGSSATPPGSTNFQLSAAETNQNNPNLDPQKQTNIEIGSKWDLANGRLSVSGAYFRTENTNVIFVVDNTAIPPIYNQDDGHLIRGVALGLVGRPLSFWDLNLNLQYLEADVVSQGANDGRRPARTPPFSGSMWTTFQLPHGVRVGGGVRYTDRIYVGTANTTSVPGYAVADALAEVPVAPRLTLRLNVYNVTDKFYIRSLNNNGQRYNPGTPRSFLLSTVVRF